jgi:hypothetical protein
MSLFTSLGSSRLGAEPSCTACGAGAQIGFNWEYYQQHNDPEHRERIAVLAPWQNLRRGWLYRCGSCQEVWHLDGSSSWMTHVSSERLPLVLEWNRAPIQLSDDMEAALAGIRPTPPDMYGNGKERRVTPCKVTSHSGQLFEVAMVCVQLDAPVQDWMQFRLGSEIAEIADSDFALPFDVRLASSRAEEIRMGFSPSLIEMPDGKRFVLNGMTNFMVEGGYRASDSRVVEGNYFREEPRPQFLQQPDIVYFVVDGDPGWTPVS